MSINTDYKTYQKIYQEKYEKIKILPTKFQESYFGEWLTYENEPIHYTTTTTTNTNPCQEIVLPPSKINDNYIFGMLLSMKSYFYIEAYYNEKPPRLSYRGSDMDIYAHIQISKNKAPYLNLYYGQSFIVKAKQIMLNNTTSLLDYLYAYKEVMERFIVSGDPRIVWCI